MSKLLNNLVVIGIYAVFAVLLLTTIYPLIWVIGTSLHPGNTLMVSSMFPKQPTLEHYVELIRNTDFVLWFRNTVTIALANAVLSTGLVAATAYAFSRFRFKGRQQGLMALLILQMFPGFLSIMAIFVLLLQTKLLDTHLGLILIYAGGSISMGTWVMKGHFDTIPKSLEEAAYIDGASHMVTLFKIILPLSLPAITFVALNSFITPFMDFILPQIVLRSSDKMTLAQGLYNMVATETNSSFTTFAAGAVLVALPITILYMYFQKYLIHGMTAGADKG
ncbi:sugar ABC transporter permease [Paenibacillus sp. ACRRX]|uniref:sugar ABC transporter permease n=1 Tax=unclassified Paenibacillus TaxID=185978 RepID=UPI001EF53873|nr:MULTISPECIES: sugar ABC transporter permease [unclassified Paenibacillus]MCG7410452.1 sugar ABC transporter permease [Paenibacillus sp. ACRRX]MDK8183873.1 sugar ABC transporter permease [Paenibacillus sp. UMB4589-SE434]